MHIPKEDFKKLSEEFSHIYNHLGDKGFISIERCWSDGKYVYYFDVTDETYPSVDKMYQFFTKKKFIKISNTSSKISSTEVGYDNLEDWIKRLAKDSYAQVTVNPTLEEGFNGRSLADSKYHPPTRIRYYPLEIVENEHTYRFMSSLNGYNYGITMISRDDDKYYNYLDKDHYIFIPNTNTVGDRIVITNRYDINTAKIFVLCYLQPELADMLQDGCFTHHSTAALLGLKMEKKLKDEFKTKYREMSELLEAEYIKYMGSATIRAFFSGESENLTVNNIKFTNNSAQYENIKIEVDGLLEYIKQFLLGNNEFDIYNVIDYYAAGISRQYNNYFPIKDAPVTEGEAETVTSYRKFKINNLDIDLQVSSTGYSRYINGVRIMKDDVATAICRAACYRDQEQYNLFLKSISRMSLKWHDIVSNGLRMKICNMSREDYSNPIPGKNFPKLKFVIEPESRRIKLKVSEDKKVAINFSKFVKKVESINRKTDGKNIKRNDTYFATIRNHAWAIEQIVKALLDCCPSANDLTNHEVVNLLSEANEVRDASLAKSREFLANAVKITGAEEITFKGQRAYKVKGSLREYVVVIGTAKVYDYETKQYRCIVNDQHYVGTGYDDIAARLLALKNDSLTQHVVRTLHGSAQPGAEQYYNYDPVRDNDETVRDVVSFLRPETV
jgi:hypothetical protein